MYEHRALMRIGTWNLEHERSGLVEQRQACTPRPWFCGWATSTRICRAPCTGAAEPDVLCSRRALGDLGLVAWNVHCDHLQREIRAIDLICGPAGIDGAVVEEIRDPKLSDHAGYVVEFELR